MGRNTEETGEHRRGREEERKKSRGREKKGKERRGLLTRRQRGQRSVEGRW